jgi:hypothetical protein
MRNVIPRSLQTSHQGLLPHEGRNCLSFAARQQAVTLILDEY